MGRELLRCKGRTVEIIYIGGDNRITQRRIEVRSIKGEIVKAFCLERQAPRAFQLSRILAVHEQVDTRRKFAVGVMYDAHGS
ncbi:hypothetical protein PAECIP111802_07202 [Paenibacillus allorhizosphaerae]|uniref:WYL domain-containing protein n=1 Tax=Paenibacillus allorhizosphaerae TaxID=2849866 RepID=A0ABM8VUE6_9BACL|nr:hypothetical protein PAECIP111802_07202 [Paenibacillus allorhizosphaerae]